MKWVLIVYLGTSQLYLPFTAHETEEDCLKALEVWEFEPGWHGTCLPGIIELERKTRRKQGR